MSCVGLTGKEFVILPLDCQLERTKSLPGSIYLSLRRFVEIFIWRWKACLDCGTTAPWEGVQTEEYRSSHL